MYGALGDGFIECHHAVALPTLITAQKTKLEDLVFVCSNCHRMIHRKRPWLTAVQDDRVAPVSPHGSLVPLRPGSITFH